MRRPQFSLKTLLWLMAVVAAFLGGMAFDRQLLNWRGAVILIEDPDGPGTWVEIKDLPASQAPR